MLHYIHKLKQIRAVQEVRAYMDVIFWPLATMSNMAGVWTVTVVTFHRYIAVCLPHHVAKFANLRVARLQASTLYALFHFGVWRLTSVWPVKELRPAPENF